MKLLYFVFLILSATMSCSKASDIEETRCGKNVSQTLEPGGTLALPETFIRKNCTISCEVSLQSFDTLRIGRGKSVYQSHYIDITKDSLHVYKYVSGYHPLQKLAHNLQIADSLSITVTSDESDCCVLTLSSGGKTLSYKLSWWGGGEPFVQNLCASPITASLGFESPDYKQPVWIIGDSYVNWLYEGRWPYYIYKWGYRGWMADHLPGGASERLVNCFINDLEYTNLRPEFAVWTMGMNDPSDKDDSTPNEKWMSAVGTFLQMCRQNGITPILSTIPSVPTRKHSAKTAWVRASGIRFIDFAEAVDPDGDGVWLDGMLYEDGVHPSVLGAEALANRVIEDFPEIKKKN